MIGPEGYPSNLTPLACKHSISTARLHDNGLEMVTLTKVGSPATHCFGLAAFLASAERMGVYMNTLFAPPLLSPLLGCTSVPGFKCGGKSQISMLWMTGLQKLRVHIYVHSHVRFRVCISGVCVCVCVRVCVCACLAIGSIKKRK